MTQLGLNFSPKKARRRSQKSTGKFRRCSFPNASDDTTVFFRGEPREYIFIRGPFGFFDAAGKRSATRYQIENFNKGIVLGSIGSRQKAKKLIQSLNKHIPKIMLKTERIKKAKNLFRYYGGVYNG